MHLGSEYQVRVAAWLAPLPDGGFVLLGPVTPLDPGALTEQDLLAFLSKELEAFVDR